MSWQAVEWVLKNSRSRGATRLVAVCIASHADQNGEQAWPSAQTIAQEAGISRSSVFPCLARLIQLGELVRIPGGGRNRTNAYRLTLVSPQASLPMETVASADKNSRRRRPKPS